MLCLRGRKRVRLEKALPLAVVEARRGCVEAPAPAPAPAAARNCKGELNHLAVKRLGRPATKEDVRRGV